MKHSLSVGVFAKNTYVNICLQQLGISQVFFKDIHDINKYDIQVIFLTKGIINNIDEIQTKKELVFLTDNKTLSELLGYKNIRGDEHSYFFNSSEGIFSKRSFMIKTKVYPLQSAIECIGSCFDVNNRKINHSGINLIKIKNIYFISFPWDIFSLISDIDWGYRPYFSPWANNFFVEVGPEVDYGAFRRLMLDVLVYAFKMVNKPLVRLKLFSQDAKILAIRIDADGFSKNSLESVLKISAATNSSFSWYIDICGWRKNLGFLKKLKKYQQEIQLHCFVHTTYKSKFVNILNLLIGKLILRMHSIKVNAIVSPFGFSYKGFLESIRFLSFKYSSEFGYAVDDLPSYPWNNTKYPLQIPVHPGSIGVYEQAGFSKKDICSHILNHIKKQIYYDNVAIIYDHPLNRMERYEKEFIDIISEFKKNGGVVMNLEEYYMKCISFPTQIDINVVNNIISLDKKYKDYYIEIWDNNAGYNFKDNIGVDKIESGQSYVDGDDSFEYPSSDLLEIINKKNINYPPDVNKNLLGYIFYVFLLYMKNSIKDFIYLK